MQQTRPTGMKAFTIVWFGQVISLMGTGMTRFAINLWAWELTGKATSLALMAFFAFAPAIILSPVAGALVDRWNRKLVMMLSDLSAGLATVLLFVLNASGNLEIWHVYLAAVFAGVGESFQFPAYSSAISTMVDKKHYARTSAMLGLAESASGIFAPIAAAALYAIIRLQGILLIDIISFSFAIAALLLVHIPQPEATTEGGEGKGSLLTESAYGFRYTWRRKPLLGLQLVFFFGNLLTSLVFVLVNPMILSRTGNNEYILATVSSALGVGGIIGGIFMSTWGGPKQRIHGVLGGWMIASSAVIMLGVGRGLPAWIIAALVSSFATPLINASNQAIWQSKVPADLQGRVFSVRRLIAQITAPAALLVAGPLADYVFEPAMQPGGLLVNTFSTLVGSGTGAGMALMFVIAGALCLTVGIAGYSIPAIRNVESLIPDYNTPVQADAAAPTEGEAEITPLPAS